MARAIAHLAAIAIKRAELIEGLTNANIVKDLFEALAAGATSFAAAKAAEVRCDLSAPVPDAVRRAGRRARARLGRVAGSRRGARARPGRSSRPGAAIEAGPGPVRAVLALGDAVAAARSRSCVRACRELGAGGGAAIGLSELHDGAGRRRRAPTARRSTPP